MTGRDQSRVTLSEDCGMTTSMTTATTTARMTKGRRRTGLSGLVAGLGFLLIAAPAIAHHSFLAEYDPEVPVKLTGTVTKVEWTNPHIWFYVNVTDETGTVTEWAFSGGPPGVLQRRGISRTAMKAGDQVVVEGFRARDGSHNASGGRVTFADGRQVFTASPQDRVPADQ